jgi:diguanylate cyclase (GGDEF)-like protein
MVNIQHLKTLKNKIAHDSEYIKYLLETDSLTGLLNRKAFKEKAEKLILGLDSSYSYGLVYSDINDFSYVNENFGYEAGNKMLKDFANILQNCPTNLLGSRIYSDFFVGLYRAPSREELLRSIEERNTDFTALQKEKYPASDISVSCGIYVIPDRHTDITIAIDNANLARRSVKNNSSIICGIYSQRMRTQRAYEQSIASELHSAISNKLIEMFLQPKFDIDTRQIIGAEALARWRNLDGTYKMPVEFIPVLEKVGYIDELDFFIYEEVLRTVEQWKKDGRRIVPVSVNFSQHHVRHPRFTDMIVETADKYDVDKSNIEIEITESCFSGDMQILFEDMGKLRSMGFKVSIDDFGIGYSTLSVLMKAPVDIVKIDKSFIDNLTRSRVDREFLNNMCKLIETVNKDVIFEGVESEEQAQILSSSGHTKAQGWLFDKARPLKRFNEKYMY